MKKRSSFLLKLIIIGGIIGGVLYFISKTNNTTISPETIDLSVDCSQIEDLLITKAVKVEVNNLSPRTHNNITVKLSGYDSGNNLVKEKVTTFERSLGANQSFSKPVTFPPKIRSCNCEIISSSPSF